VLSRKDGKCEVFLGFKNELTTENDPELFESIVNGILPGRKIILQETINISSLADGYRHGGMVTGVPILKKNEDKQNFNLSSVARSLYGKEYLLAIISRPISEIDKQNSFNQLIQIRDRLHSLAKRTVGEEKGSGRSVSETETSTTGSSKTSGHSVGGTAGISFPIPFGLLEVAPPTRIIGLIQQPKAHPEERQKPFLNNNPNLFPLSSKMAMPWSWRKLQTSI